VRAILLPLPDGDFALPVDVVREVAAAPPVTALPGAPRTVLGVFNLRAEVLPVLDTMAALGGESGSSAAYAVVAASGTDAVALAASGLPAIVDLGEQAQLSETPGTAGSYLFQGRLVTVIDLPELLVHAGLGADALPEGAGAR
jgi:chemotaxis signal transduction protein